MKPASKSAKGRPAPRGPELTSGKSVGGGRYTLNIPLDAGATLWLAQDETAGRIVELLFLPRELQRDPRAMDEMRRQVAASSKLEHSGLAHIYELYEAPGLEPFVATEYVEGKSLTALRNEQPNTLLSWEALTPLLQQLGAALKYTHEQQAVHRGLNPANLIIDQDGRLKLVNSGIAGVFNDPLLVGLTTGSGSPLHYFSPQQIDGQSASPADDFYSLGVTLYEALTGTTPFHTGDLLPQIRNAAPAPLAERLAELNLSNRVPDEAAQFVLGCLAKNPAERPTRIPVPEPQPQPLVVVAAPVSSGSLISAARGVARPLPREDIIELKQARSHARRYARRPQMALAAALAFLAVAAAGAWYFTGTGPKPVQTAKQNPPAKTGGHLAANTLASNTPATPSPADLQREAEEKALREAEEKKRIEAARQAELARQAETKRQAEAARLAEQKRQAELASRQAAEEEAQQFAAAAEARRQAELEKLAENSEEGFVQLFNGRSLEGWSGDTNHWSVKDSLLTAQIRADAPKDTKIRSWLIWTADTVDDFELRFSYRLRPIKGNTQPNAGISYRSKKEDGYALQGYQFDLAMDSRTLGSVYHESQHKRLAGYGESVLATREGSKDRLKVVSRVTETNSISAIKKDSWNDCVIQARGNRIVHKINGVVIAELKDENQETQFLSGLLGLEVYGSHTNNPATFVQYKNIRLKKFGPGPLQTAAKTSSGE